MTGTEFFILFILIIFGNFLFICAISRKSKVPQPPPQEKKTKKVCNPSQIPCKIPEPTPMPTVLPGEPQEKEEKEKFPQNISQICEIIQKELSPDAEHVAEAIDALCPGEVLFVHGGAGTGKSTLIRELFFKNKIGVCLAPTGLAAININGKTIHKFFSFRPLPHFIKNNNPHKSGGLSKETENILSMRPVICIDEISMVRADMLDAIDYTLRHFYHTQEAFGGLKMLFVGDLFQLPPIVERKVKNFFDPGDKNWIESDSWYSEYFLDAESVKKCRIKRIDLTTHWRQQNDPEFNNMLNDIRTYQNLEIALEKINKNHGPALPDSVFITGDNAKAKNWNNQKLNTINNIEYSYHAMATGSYNEIKKEEDLPAPPLIRLKKDAFVMIIVNDKNERYVNGSTGKIIDLNDSMVKIKLKNGNVVEVGFNKWASYELTKINNQKPDYEETGTYTQIPVVPAWAITVHISQG